MACLFVSMTIRRRELDESKQKLHTELLEAFEQWRGAKRQQYERRQFGAPSVAFRKGSPMHSTTYEYLGNTLRCRCWKSHHCELTDANTAATPKRSGKSFGRDEGRPITSLLVPSPPRRIRRTLRPNFRSRDTTTGVETAKPANAGKRKSHTHSN